MAETLEAQAASLRRHAAEIATEGQGALELETPNPWIEHDGGDCPDGAVGKVVEVRLRDGYQMTGPAHALTWAWEENLPENEGLRDIVEWRFSAEQPDACA